MEGRSLLTLASAAVAAALASSPAAASMLWSWSYSAPGIEASGTFITEDVPDESGFYLITDIEGTRNGEEITGLQETGTPIPGNAPYAVDNLVGLDEEQLTKSGFGYSTDGGHFANPFFANFLEPPVYLECFTVPPLEELECKGQGDTELEIEFSATRVPESDARALWVLGLATVALLWFVARRRRDGPEDAASQGGPGA